MEEVERHNCRQRHDRIYREEVAELYVQHRGSDQRSGEKAFPASKDPLAEHVNHQDRRGVGQR